MKGRERGEGGFFSTWYEAFFYRCRAGSPKKCDLGGQWGSVARMTCNYQLLRWPNGIYKIHSASHISFINLCAVMRPIWSNSSNPIIGGH